MNALASHGELERHALLPAATAGRAATRFSWISAISRRRTPICQPERLGAPEVTFPLEGLCLRGMLARAASRACGGGALFTADYAYFSSVSQSWVAHAQAMSKRWWRASAWASGKLCRRSGVERRLSFAVRGGARHSLPRYRADGRHCRGSARERDRNRRGFLRRGNGPGHRIGAAQGRSRRPPTTCWPTSPISTISSRGIGALLAPEGVDYLRISAFVRLIEGVQFDTVYHEHYSYLSLYTVRRIWRRRAPGVRCRRASHAWRVFARLCRPRRRRPCGEPERLEKTWHRRGRAGLRKTAVYGGLQAEAERIKDELLMFLIAEKRAAARWPATAPRRKATRFLNFAGVRPDLLALRLRRSALEAGQVPAGQPHPDPGALRACGGAGRIWSSSCPGISPARSEKLPEVRAWGGGSPSLCRG